MPRAPRPSGKPEQPREVSNREVCWGLVAIAVMLLFAYLCWNYIDFS